MTRSMNKLFVSAQANLLTFTLLLQTLAGPPALAAPAAKPKTGGATWTLSGYLPANPKQKVYLKIEGKKIAALGTQAPAKGAGLVVDTNDWIFPGLIDMHSHVKYNILPLWDLAKGQFTNRFEWRQKFPAYKDAVSFNMKPIRGDTVCAAVRYAEIKAMTGGATAIQGIGGDSKCAKDFGIHNLEIPGEFENTQKIRGMTDMIMPDMMGNVFEAEIAPLMKSKKLTYDKALAAVLEKQGVTKWIKTFIKEPHNLANGVELLIGSAAGAKGSSKADFKAAEAKITAYLEKEYELNEKAIAKQLAAMEVFLFGKGATPGYLTMKGTPTESNALDYLSKGGVLTVTGSIRRYLGMFETSVRKSAQAYYADPTRLAIVAHLSEGGRDDAYNKSEYQYAKTMDLAKSGLTIIHGVGMDAKDFAHAAKNQISIVWSPFSNLLLYGETLDVKAARAAGVNVTIGADWTPTGSKTILDELKLAKRYLDHEGIKGISDKDLVDMATINAALAIHREKVVGQVAPGYQADLLLVGRTPSANPYTELLDTTQKDVDLVVVAGQPTYGDAEWIGQVADSFKDKKAPEAMDACGADKALRLGAPTAYDTSLASSSGPKLDSLAGIEKELASKLKAYASEVKKTATARLASALVPGIDPLFSCDDEAYSKRFDSFIEKELDANRKSREKLRVQYKLDDSWSPLKLSAEESEDDEESAE